MENQIKLNLADLSIDEVNAILIALQELPGKICNPLSQKIKVQAEEQINNAKGEGRVLNKNIAENVATADKVGG